MPQYRAGFTLTVDNGIGDEALGAMLDRLKNHNGTVVVDSDWIQVVFSFDASDLPGWYSGLSAALPRAIGICRRVIGDLESQPLGFTLTKVTEEEAS